MMLSQNAATTTYFLYLAFRCLSINKWVYVVGKMSINAFNLGCVGIFSIDGGQHKKTDAPSDK